MDFFYSTVFCMIYLYALDYDCTDILNGPPANRVLEAIKYIMSDSFLRDSGLSHAPLLVEDINGMIIYQCNVCDPGRDKRQYENIQKFSIALWNSSYSSTPRCLTTLDFLDRSLELFDEQTLVGTVWPVIYWFSLPHNDFRREGPKEVPGGSFQQCLDILVANLAFLTNSQNDLDREKVEALTNWLPWLED
ncbi:hypothetical protein PFICI_03094 [Pestalotiopsis fici W106-1]|uniref:Uncharacterized protein n=1 Tax=Pestalotiopsis fici (strain W106-1 / CGMCC3.15140) TaxID=1229662 RepID=W3XGD1_PESFW|nr:uncharacterized protein PFICI_03094 [Pestalotiopsis fici W106-1]ETS85069.1 hypothetical protein PFICI_03094 [Pestalotiopsis fici W106-1]